MLPEQGGAREIDSAPTKVTDVSRPKLFLLYHELRPEPSSYSYALTCDEFRKHLALFSRLREALNPGLWPEITFDDGHRSNYEHALPALDQYRIQGRFFITAGWVGHKTGYMSWNELRSLHSAGHLIGAHGWTHTLLTHCTGNALDMELRGARHALEDALGTQITTMSLPGGRFSSRVLTACREAGYTQVFTSLPRAEPTPAAPVMGRLNIRGNHSLPWIESLFDPRSRVLAGLERQERLKSTVRAVLGDRAYGRLWALLNRHDNQENLNEARAYERSAHHQ